MGCHSQTNNKTYFFNIINGHHTSLSNITFESFLNQLHDDAVTNGYFQQDSAKAHTTHDTVEHME
jgi:hypothetical protein